MIRVSLLALCGIAFTIGLAPLTRADGLIVVHDGAVGIPPNPSGPHYAFTPLQVKYHHVTVDITDPVAVTEVDQVFINPHNRQLEGTYLFPIPAGAQIDKFTMDINGKPVEAELVDAAKARQLYEEIVRKARDPALLEYVGQGLFKVRIFPIEPGSEKHVQIKYTQVLTTDSGMTQYVYPLNTEKFSAAPLGSVSIKVNLKTQRPIQALYSPSHAVEIARHGATRATIGFEARNVRPDTDFQLFFAQDDAKDVGLNLLTYNDGRNPDGGYFMLLASPTKHQNEQFIAKDVVFVLDTSGSMADGHKLEQAKQALRLCLKNLNACDRFELVRFSTEAEPLFRSLAPVDDQHLAQAEEFIDRFKPIGGTAIEAALTQALAPARSSGSRDRPYFVVFLTDGQPTVGNKNEDHILATVARAGHGRTVRVFCFGVGTDVNTHLLDRLAESTRGVSQYVLPNEDIEVKVSSFYAKISQPVLANLKLKISGSVRLEKLSPTELPDLFAGEQLILYGRYTGSGPTALTLEGTVNGHPCAVSYTGEFARQDTQHTFIPRLWATRRVGYLLDQIRLQGQNKELREEVTALAREYGIVTPYTACLILEDEGGRGIPPSRQSLSAMERDDVRLGVGRMYKEANEVKAGDAAVGNAQAYDALKRADKPTDSAAANRYAQRGQTGGAAAEGERIQQAIDAQQMRYVRGRMFYQNGAQWIDAQAQSRPDARRVQVRFNSEDYFNLLRDHPEATQWLSVGQNVQLLMNDTVFEVTE